MREKRVKKRDRSGAVFVPPGHSYVRVLSDNVIEISNPPLPPSPPVGSVGGSFLGLGKDSQPPLGY